MRVLAIAVLTLLLLACDKSSTTPVEEVAEPALKKFNYKHDDILREVGVYDPREQGDETPRPLVIGLHGGLGGDEEAVRLSFGKLNAIAEDEDILVVYPNGINGHWNDGRGVQDYLAQSAELKDVDFIVSLIDDFVEGWHVNPEQVFVLGVSDGAMMAERLACERPDKVTAVASVIGALPLEVARRKWRCKGKDPVAILMIRGTEDPIVPWAGGDVTYDGKAFGQVLSADEGFAFWSRRNGCSGEPREETLPDSVPDDGTLVRRRQAADCKPGGRVELLALEGGGHSWPSGWQYLPEETVGRVSREIDAADASWAFFMGSLLDTPMANRR